ncbi:SDR family NAD(P)-dependent oxidoreductase [Nocardia sp. NPDC050175]|uniref:type I polyketide synthase n=1 Tax=Nocardia sp. NPDC050175 TaxID=3364317 RepID=UPI0037A89004
MTRPVIVGMACRYPDAATPAELWENVLAGRRAFRPIPDVRLAAADYYSADPAAPDRHHATHAAVLEGWTFDRARHRISAGLYRSTDIAHWLALDTAAAALADAGFPAGEGLARARTGVVFGNTLTGDMTRATGMRLRWPYVRRTLAAALRRRGWADAEIGEFLAEYEADYKAPFPAITEDSLAGGLANTIAGRVCNHFDLGGGGFTVDGACSSSLLAVTYACDALVAGRLDAVVVGGVDVSIDPFELVGFAKTDALSTSEMRVYDERSNGFWPGEGCGVVVLVREEDAVARGLRCYATVAGWGISSDGRGNITRPDRDGHLRAIENAYDMAGFGIDTVGYLEGHGTGTAVGDRTELEAFDRALQTAGRAGAPVALGAIKGNIGHTKAAAGLAALIKTTLAVHHGVIPPITGSQRAHPMLADSALYLPDTARAWPQPDQRRAGLSSLGFGGINTHVALDSHRSPKPLSRTLFGCLAHSAQDSELLTLSAATPAQLQARLRTVAALAAQCSFAELGDLACELIRSDADLPVKAAVVIAGQEQAARSLTELADALEAGASHRIDGARGQFLGADTATGPRIGLLFPGQGAPGRGDGGAVARRFAVVADLYEQVGVRSDSLRTEQAQPRIVTASLAGLRLLATADLEAVGCVGHSLGEMVALHWAGVFDESTVVRAAEFRGRAMATVPEPGGMGTIHASADRVAPLLAGGPVVIAAYNGPEQTVIAGPAAAVEAVLTSARSGGLQGRILQVSHAFHSPLVAPAARVFRDYLDEIAMSHVKRPGLVSTVTGEPLEPGSAVVDLLERQVRAPVRFAAALTQLAQGCDLLVEVGPGSTLTALAADVCPAVPVVAMDTDGDSVAGVLRALGACYVLGAGPDLRGLLAERFSRPITTDKRFEFIENPCEQAPEDVIPVHSAPSDARSDVDVRPGPSEPGSPLEALRALLAGRAELPIEAITPDLRPMDDLHLSSITITQLVADTARQLGASVPGPTTAVATATIAELADAIEDASGTTDSVVDELVGADVWVRPFAVEWIDRPVPFTGYRDLEEGRWQVFAPEGDRLATVIGSRLIGLGSGVLLSLAAPQRESVSVAIDRMLRAARTAADTGARLVVVDGDRGRAAAALAKSVHLEVPAVRTTVVQVAEGLAAERIAGLVRADVAATTAFREVRYDAKGTRAEPVLRELILEPARLPVAAGDVVAVTGGIQGITVECAAALARRTGCTLAVIARTAADDPVVVAELARLRESGITAAYFAADVTDPERVAEAVAAIGDELGPITGILHGAGVNAPTAVGALDSDEFARTVAPKIDGLHNLLVPVDRARLRFVVGFGSIIGRAGLRGEAHYAIANDWLRADIDALAAELPSCRCLTIEWSVWAGIGMGERLGVLNTLLHSGIEPIPADAGAAAMLDLLAAEPGQTSAIVIGRTAELPTLRFEDVELPLLRFLERPRLHFPGIEVVADADLSMVTDPYLADHRFAGDALFPAVLGMEAMAQAAAALFGTRDGIELSRLEFHRPIVVASDAATTIRVAAVRSGDRVHAVIRSQATGFQLDHFRGVCERVRADEAPVGAAITGSALDLAVDTEFYDRIMFHGPLFRSVQEYWQLSARHCVARLRIGGARWFSPLLPNSLVLADPAVRDACMHAIQVCVPDATLLPSKIERVRSFPVAPEVRTVTLSARERTHDGPRYVYDVVVQDDRDALVAAWEGLELIAVAPLAMPGGWTPELLGPYLQRRLDELLPAPVRVAVVRDGTRTRHEASRRALSVAVGRDAVLRHRPDGRPETPDSCVSLSHATGLTAAIAAAYPVGCDLEPVAPRSAAQWTELLGESGMTLAQACCRMAGESLDTAATRVWGAREAVTKLGTAVTWARLTLDRDSAADGWLAFRHGRQLVWSFATSVALPSALPMVFSIAEKS